MTPQEAFSRIRELDDDIFIRTAVDDTHTDRQMEVWREKKEQTLDDLEEGARDYISIGQLFEMAEDEESLYESSIEATFWIACRIHAIEIAPSVLKDALERVEWASSYEIAAPLFEHIITHIEDDNPPIHARLTPIREFAEIVVKTIQESIINGDTYDESVGIIVDNMEEIEQDFINAEGQYGCRHRR